MKSFRALLFAGVAGIALLALPVSSPADTPEQRYIVLLDAPPLAAYRGGIAGLAPTSPAATGARRLDVDSAASRAYLAYLAQQQRDAIARAEAAVGHSLNVRFRYSAALNGFAAVLSSGEAATIARLPGVARVVADSTRELLTDNGPPWIGAPGIWNGSTTGGAPGTMGEGVVVGVIDTGVNTDHPSFADPGPTDGFNHTNPKGRFFGACDPVTGRPFCNDKLIGAHDFTGTGPDDEIGHGSHTASTSAGNVLDASFVAPTLTLNRRISGVAPHANVISYKACQAATGNCLITSLVAAINQTVLDEVDVVNYSIGGASSNPWSDLDAVAFLSAREAGIFISASAGNAGPGAGTVGSPSDSPWVLSVAASTHDRKYVNTLADMSGGTTPPPANIEGKSVTAGYGPARIVYAGAAPYNNPLCNPFPAGTFRGEIVVCDRGVVGRVAKGQNVKDAGGGGMVLVNDAPNGDSLVADPHVLPAVHISFSKGDTALKPWLASGSGHSARITGTVQDIRAENADIMASFSSRGPNPSVPDVIKPEVTAPGVDIFAAFNSTIPPGPRPEFGIISGTSMSSPHAAGSAALLRALHPEWSPDEVKSALVTTAFRRLPGTGSEVHQVLKEDGTTASDPFDRGGGRVDLRLAGKAGLVLDVPVTSYRAADPGSGGNPRTLNLPTLGEDSCAGTCSWTRVVTAKRAGTWSVATSAPAGMALSVSPATFTLAAGGTETLSVTADVRAAADSTWHFGEVILIPSDSSVPETHLTVAARKSGGSIVMTPLHFHGNLHDPGCTGNGAIDVALVACGGPFLSTNATLDSNPAAKWPVTTSLNCTVARCASDPNFIWNLAGETKVAGPMTVEWWMQCPACNLLLAEDWFIRLWADGTQVFEARLRFNTPVPGTTTRLSATVALPEIVATNDIVLHVDPIFLNQQGTFVYYDSTQACPGRNAGPCDSVVHMPVVQTPVANQPPNAVDDSASVARGGSVAIDVLANDTDPDSGDTLTVTSVSDPPFGTATINADNRSVTYTQDGGPTAADSFTYTVSDGKGGTDTATVNITVTGPDLVVSAITVTSNTGAGGENQQPKQGQKATVTATIANNGSAAAPATQTTFVLDETTVLGDVATDPIPAGQSVNVSASWDTRGVSGQHTIKVTADSATPGQAAETNEGNNTATLTVTVQGNKVKNGSFEQSSSGSAPDNWTSSGETTYEQGGSDGERSVGAGPGGSWTSDPIDVTPGASYDLEVAIAGAIGGIAVEQLSGTGQLLRTVTIPVPAIGGVFSTVTDSITVGSDAVAVRVKLSGPLLGTAHFDAVGMFDR
jgi:subtilisin family serine protease